MGRCIQHYILAVITYFAYLVSENSSVIASKQGFREVTETGTQSAWNEQPSGRWNWREVLSSFVRLFPRGCVYTVFWFPWFQSTKSLLRKFERNTAKRTEESQGHGVPHVLSTPTEFWATVQNTLATGFLLHVHLTLYYPSKYCSSYNNILYWTWSYGTWLSYTSSLGETHWFP